jgi:hypothetical protein
MPSFNFEQIFGSNVALSTSPLPSADLTINLFDFLDQANGENLPEGLGVQDPQTMTATQVLYALLLLLKCRKNNCYRYKRWTGKKVIYRQLLYRCGVSWNSCGWAN